MNGVYTVTTGSGRSPEQAIEGLLPPGVSAVLIKTETWGRTVRYHYVLA